MSKLNWWKTACAVFLMCAATAIASTAQTFTTLLDFDRTDGANPSAGLIQATDGNLYGTTASGGGGLCYYGCGTAFKMTPSGTLTTLYNFCSAYDCGDGAGPLTGLVQATDGNFYGTTYGGAYNHGTVFKMTSTGTLTTLYYFCSQSGCADGSFPYSALTQARDHNFYGTTTEGGTNGYGTVFKITTAGALTTLYSFCSQAGCTDGATPMAGLVEGTDGNLYGTTMNGGANDRGTVFKLTLTDTLTTLYSFCSISYECEDGSLPDAALIEAADGNFYGTTMAGGAGDECGEPGCGTVFEITPDGVFTKVHAFNYFDGWEPMATLVQGSDGNFYGTTNYGGVYGGDYGEVFEMAPSGTVTVLYSFCYSCDNGANPEAPLVQDTNGTFYGTTYTYGGYGTVFSVSVGLGAFVETQPTHGKVGAAVKILGTNLKGATGVTFNGTPAAFIVEASSVIRATVPPGATTGTVQVVTPSGTLSSNVPFRVAP